MTGVTDGEPYLPIQLVTGDRITFTRNTTMTLEPGIPDTAILWGSGEALSWGGDGNDLLW